MAEWLVIDRPTPASSGGTNYATGGAETGDGYEKGTALVCSQVEATGGYGFPNLVSRFSDYFAKTDCLPRRHPLRNLGRRK